MTTLSLGTGRSGATSATARPRWPHFDGCAVLIALALTATARTPPPPHPTLLFTLTNVKVPLKITRLHASTRLRGAVYKKCTSSCAPSDSTCVAPQSVSTFAAAALSTSVGATTPSPTIPAPHAARISSGVSPTSTAVLTLSFSMHSLTPSGTGLLAASPKQTA
eukprot:m.449688 g.449688  ORF g.449688 m.449688 type:complete len:164 (+) comp19857_c0_seq1:1058-1549(+)